MYMYMRKVVSSGKKISGLKGEISNDVFYQELMSAAKQREGSNYRTLFVSSSVESHALNLAENLPYKVSCMLTPTSLRSQQVAIITAGGLLGTHTSHSSNLKAH